MRRSSPYTVLVTGSGGFLGGQLLAALAAQGDRVLTMGTRALARPGGTHHLVDDLTDARAFSRLFSSLRPDWIIHLGGTTHGSDTQLYTINALWGLAILRGASLLTSPPAVLLTGSAAEYGPQGANPGSSFGHEIDENTPCLPVTPYGISKLAQTLHGLAFSRKQPVVVARPFNIVGADMPESLALGSFIRQVAAMPPEGGTLCTGSLHAERDFIGVKDVACLLAALIHCPKATGCVVNLCTGQGTRMNDLVQALIAASPSPVRLDCAPPTQENDVSVGSCRGLRELGLQVPDNPLQELLRTVFAPESPSPPA